MLFLGRKQKMVQLERYINIYMQHEIGKTKKRMGMNREDSFLT